ncbi:uncharacterized protein Z519_09979 [Cladophialophora bantiana CBS 173.52]|uniref:Uncharacterized protein n=1 Tax=Cladophialophora bantiana (strain ATCC 10958 / CBS 173.52 / CDC B-1940 / NIH 8579) TaxID=1442370 RepID=A0A0D2FR98_CLAB1|nr:uncharacterized protein Z519_09979 [Cladophialophora bantiana CBS 173.52]KIW89127.1 hypothetical protein Z519_09979 [Cladophialophora bantiana CBS 173.52]
MADGNPLGLQPDFNLISDELKKAQNLPAINNGQQILAELRAIRRDLADIRRDLADNRRDLADTRRDLADTRRDLITMMTVSNHNNTARVQNTYVASRSEPLSSFLNPSNGAAIPEFPPTSTELGQMTGRQMDTVLQQLGLQPAHGASLTAKKKMLRTHIGLREVAAVPPP